MRTRSSRRLEESAEPEQLQELVHVSTRRRGRKTTGKSAQAEPVANDSASAQDVPSGVQPERPTALSPVKESKPAHSEAADIPGGGVTHQAATTADTAQLQITHEEAQFDFLIEGQKLAEAILQGSEDGSPAANKDKQPRICQLEEVPNLEHPSRESLALPGHAQQVCAVSTADEGLCGPSTARATGVHAPSASGDTVSDRQPIQQDALPADAGEHSQSVKTAHLPRPVQPSRSAGESQELQQPSVTACPQNQQGAEKDSEPVDTASSRPPIGSLQATTSNALHARRSMRTGSLEAYEKGRRSGIWQGAANASMGALEQDWDSYKATSLRGWTMPSLKDAQAKSQALALSGFTVVSSPKISATSKAKLQKPVRDENKRKADGNAQEAAAAPRKAPKIGDMPSKAQASAKGRAWTASPSRFRQNTSSNLPAPKGKGATGSMGLTDGASLRPLGERIPRPQKGV